MKVLKPLTAPSKFDAAYLARLDNVAAARVYTYLANDIIKASHGQFDKMWMKGTYSDARDRFAAMRSHGRANLGWDIV